MSLILNISGHDALDNGEPTTLRLNRHGAVIGRSPHADWSLPDTRNLISSRHCEISYSEGQYLLVDHSTNGTYLNGAADRLPAAHPIADGDRITIGHYIVTASMGDARGAGTAESARPLLSPQNEGWDAFPAPQQASSGGDGWADPPEPPIDPHGKWQREPDPATSATADPWDMPAPLTRPSAWSSEPSLAHAPTAEDVWGRLSEESEIDWSRGNFASIAPADDNWGSLSPAASTAEASRDAEWNEAGSPTSSRDAEPDERAMPASNGWKGFVAGSGLPAERLTRSPGESLDAAGAILRQMIGGLMLMIEARARGKAQLGVQATGLELDGNNPLKFVRSPERALLQLINPPEPGFMPATRAIEDAYQDLQAHQMATLTAMRGALEGTLAGFSPAAIRDRADQGGWLARWFPMLRRARHWDAYEHDFEGVVRGADEAFMDLFGKEFRLHYDRHIAEMKARRHREEKG